MSTAEKYHPSYQRSLQGPVLLVVLIALTLSGLVLSAFHWASGPLHRSNQAYLERSISDTIHLIIPVGIAKGALDLVEGTTLTLEAGVVLANAGTNVEVGDTLQPLLEYMDLAWRILLMNLMYLTACKFILLGYGPIAEYLFLATLIGFLVQSLLHLRLDHRHQLCLAVRKVSSICLLGTLLFSLMLPLTVFFSARMAAVTTEPVRADLQVTFDEMAEVYNLDAFHKAEGLKDRATALSEKTVELFRYAADATAEVAGAIAKLGVIKILNGVVFPLASLIFLIWIVRGTLFPALGLGRRGLAEEDIAWLREVLRPERKRFSYVTESGGDGGQEKTTDRS